MFVLDSWPTHGCGTSVPAGGPRIGRRLQLRLDGKSLPHHRVDEEGVWSGENMHLRYDSTRCCATFETVVIEGILTMWRHGGPTQQLLNSRPSQLFFVNSKGQIRALSSACP